MKRSDPCAGHSSFFFAQKGNGEIRIHKNGKINRKIQL